MKGFYKFLVLFALLIISVTYQVSAFPQQLNILQFMDDEVLPGKPAYYLSVDGDTPHIDPEDELQRSQRSFWKKLLKTSGLGDLFGDDSCSTCNGCADGSCNKAQTSYGDSYYQPPFSLPQPFQTLQPLRMLQPILNTPLGMLDSVVGGGSSYGLNYPSRGSFNSYSSRGSPNYGSYSSVNSLPASPSYPSTSYSSLISPTTGYGNASPSRGIFSYGSLSPNSLPPTSSTVQEPSSEQPSRTSVGFNGFSAPAGQISSFSYGAPGNINRENYVPRPISPETATSEAVNPGFGQTGSNNYDKVSPSNIQVNSNVAIPANQTQHEQALNVVQPTNIKASSDASAANSGSYSSKSNPQTNKLSEYSSEAGNSLPLPHQNSFVPNSLEPSENSNTAPMSHKSSSPVNTKIKLSPQRSQALENPVAEYTSPGQHSLPVTNPMEAQDIPKASEPDISPLPLSPVQSFSNTAQSSLPIPQQVQANTQDILAPTLNTDQGHVHPSLPASSVVVDPHPAIQHSVSTQLQFHESTKDLAPEAPVQSTANKLIPPVHTPIHIPSPPSVQPFMQQLSPITTTSTPAPMNINKPEENPVVPDAIPGEHHATSNNVDSQRNHIGEETASGHQNDRINGSTGTSIETNPVKIPTTGQPQILYQPIIYVSPQYQQIQPQSLLSHDIPTNLQFGLNGWNSGYQQTIEGNFPQKPHNHVHQQLHHSHQETHSQAQLQHKVHEQNQFEQAIGHQNQIIDYPLHHSAGPVQYDDLPPADLEPTHYEDASQQQQKLDSNSHIEHKKAQGFIVPKQSEIPSEPIDVEFNQPHHFDSQDHTQTYSDCSQENQPQHSDKSPHNSCSTEKNPDVEPPNLIEPIIPQTTPSVTKNDVEPPKYNCESSPDCGTLSWPWPFIPPWPVLYYTTAPFLNSSPTTIVSPTPSIRSLMPETFYLHQSLYQMPNPGVNSFPWQQHNLQEQTPSATIFPNTPPTSSIGTFPIAPLSNFGGTALHSGRKNKDLTTVSTIFTVIGPRPIAPEISVFPQAYGLNYSPHNILQYPSTEPFIHPYTGLLIPLPREIPLFPTATQMSTLMHAPIETTFYHPPVSAFLKPTNALQNEQNELNMGDPHSTWSLFPETLADIHHRMVSAHLNQN